MYLLIITTLLSFLSASTTIVSKPLISWLKKPSKQERGIQTEIMELRKEQTQISIVDNFAAHAKLQRKINSLEMRLQNESSDRNTNKYILQFAITYGIKLLFGFVLLCIVIYYRRTPVFIFPEYIDLYPLNTLISYPNETLGAVSVHFWLMITNSVARQLIK